MFNLSDLVKLGFCIENDYFKNYEELIVKNLNNPPQQFHTQSHHIIPKCIYKNLGIFDKNIIDENNIVELSIKDHVQAHYYLMLCAKGRFKYQATLAVIRCLSVINNDNYYSKIDDKIDLPKEMFDDIERRRCIAIKKLNTGRKLIHRGSEEKYISSVNLDLLSTYLDDGWELGRARKHIYVTKNMVNKKIQIDELLSYINDGWIRGVSQKKKLNYKNRIIIHMDEHEKHIRPEDLDKYLSSGWEKGRPLSFKVKNSRKSADTVYINKDNVQKRIDKNSIEKFLAEGWKLGRGASFIRIYRGSEEKHIPENSLDEYLLDGWILSMPSDRRQKLKETHPGHQAWNKGISPTQSTIEKAKNTKRERYPNGLHIPRSEKTRAQIGAKHRGRIYIVKDDIIKSIYPENLQKYLDQGWRKGRK